MKKKITAIIIVCSLLLTIFPLQAFAAGNEEDNLILEASGNTLIVKLNLPNAKGEKLSSVQLRLSLDTGAFSDFYFDEAVTGKAKVYEAHYSQDRRQVDLYIAGTTPLFDGDSLIIGSVHAEANGSTASSAEVLGGNVLVVRGSKTEDMELSALQEISLKDSGSNSGNFGTQGGYNPGQPVPGGIKPATPEEPDTPQQPQEPEPPKEEPAEEHAIIMPRLLKVQNAAAGVTIKWSKSSNAAGYYVYRKSTGGRWKRIAAVEGKAKISYTDKAVKSKNGKTYLYTVKAYNGKKTSTYDKAGIKIRRLTAPALSKPVSKAAAKMLVKWKQNKKADGYQVQYARSADFKKQKGSKTVKPVTKTSQTVNKLKRGKTYYVRVRCYKKVGAATYYSAWSAAKKVKIK